MKLFEIEYYHANNDKLFVMHINAEDKRDAMLKFNKMQKKNKDIVVNNCGCDGNRGENCKCKNK